MLEMTGFKKYTIKLYMNKLYPSVNINLDHTFLEKNCFLFLTSFAMCYMLESNKFVYEISEEIKNEVLVFLELLKPNMYVYIPKCGKFITPMNRRFEIRIGDQDASYK